mmetsp:Transcript_10164/g.29875  ORF Transcript_10164/g.29875 Transcript_10164/m.29875 type:complete len:113 (+) Transcript_10164:1585-1923(+)
MVVSDVVRRLLFDSPSAACDAAVVANAVSNVVFVEQQRECLFLPQLQPLEQQQQERNRNVSSLAGWPSIVWGRTIRRSITTTATTTTTTAIAAITLSTLVHINANITANPNG